MASTIVGVRVGAIVGEVACAEQVPRSRITPSWVLEPNLPAQRPSVIGPREL